VIQRVKLTRDESFVYEADIWNNTLIGGTSHEAMAQNFATMAEKFMAAQWNGSAVKGDQQGALAAMFNFMLVYGLWANQCPHFPWHSASSSTQVPEYELMNDVGGNSQILDTFTGANGLLK